MSSFDFTRENEHEINEKAFAVFVDERVHVIETEKNHVEKERQMNGPIDVDTFDDQFGEKHQRKIAPKKTRNQY